MSKVPTPSEENQKSKKKLAVVKDTIEETDIDPRLFLDSIPISVCIVDEDSKIINANIAFTKLVAYTRDQLIGMNIIQLVPADEELGFSAYLQRTGGYNESAQWPIRTRTEEVVPVLVTTAYQINDESGQAQQIIFLVDVQQQDQSLHELQNTIDMLKQHLAVQKKTHKLSEHDLKNDVGSMVNIGDLLLHRQPKEEQKKWLNLLVQVGHKTLNKLKSSDDFQRMEQGSFTLETSQFDLGETILTITQDLDEMFVMKSVSLSLFFQNAPVEPTDFSLQIEASDFYIHRLLYLLMKNALQASPENSEVSLNIDVSDAIVLTFTNQGLIPEYHRSDDSSESISLRASGAAGIGAYQARLIAEAHQGAVNYSTTEQPASVAIVRLPAYLFAG